MHKQSQVALEDELSQVQGGKASDEGTDMDSLNSAPHDENAASTEDWMGRKLKGRYWYEFVLNNKFNF
jgi:hypothetical protein